MIINKRLDNIQENVFLTNHTTFRIGGPAKYFFEAQTAKDIKNAILWAKENRLPYFVLGGGSNILVSDKGFDGLVIKIQNSTLRLRSGQEFCIVEAEAGVPLIKIILETTRLGYSGAEWGFGIPGTIGGAVCGNAGAYGHRISECVQKVLALNSNGEIRKYTNKDCEFDYRESIFKKNKEIIIEVELKLRQGSKEESQNQINQYLRERKEKIPPFPSAGSVFKNLELTSQSEGFQKLIPAEKIKNGMISAGYLIDECRLRGHQIGQAQISTTHANFIVNLGGAKAADVLELVYLCKKSVKEKYGIELEEEIRYLGF